ncbi:MAG: AzlD domain-containing protein [Clostridia bacterium]|nr:AzlD domain-containing protein [Clostridia bacterium]
MDWKIIVYIACMAGVTYLIRVLPLTLIRKEIKNKTIRSFLYYVPYVTLAVMTFPAVIHSTQSVFAGIAALIVAMVIAFFGKGLLWTAVGACLTVFIIELFTHPFW